MVPRPSSVLVLDDATVPAVLSVPGVVLHHAGGILQAAALMASAHPRLVLMRPERAWHRRFLLTLPSSVRPTVVAVGTKAPPELADGWVDPRLSQEDAALALEYAEQRAELRRLRATVAPARPDFAGALDAA